MPSLDDFADDFAKEFKRKLTAGETSSIAARKIKERLDKISYTISGEPLKKEDFEYLVSGIETKLSKRTEEYLVESEDSRVLIKMLKGNEGGKK
jgi:hypothetical protein